MFQSDFMALFVLLLVIQFVTEYLVYAAGKDLPEHHWKKLCARFLVMPLMIALVAMYAPPRFQGLSPMTFLLPGIIGAFSGRIMWQKLKPIFLTKKK